MCSRQLNHTETDLIAKGLNFSITSKTLPNKQIMDTVKDLEKEETNATRAKVRITIQNPKLPKDKLLRIYISCNFAN